MNNSGSERRKSLRLNEKTIILCSKCISEGERNVFSPSVGLDVINISGEGLCVSAIHEFKKGAMLELDITMEDVPYKAVTARIIWSVKHKSLYNYGLRIENITGKFKSHIERLEARISTRI